MEKEALLRKLNWFYTLEVNQVKMYLNQSLKTGDPHLERAFKKFAEIEQGHVENIGGLIEKLGESPSLIGEAVGKITGGIAGKISGFSEWEKTLEFNISLEKKAITDYKELAEDISNLNMREVLLNNMLDEEMHAAWMTDYITG